MEKVIPPNDFDFEKYKKIKPAKRRRGNPGAHAKIKYHMPVAAFDIETSRLPGSDDSFMYIWQFKIEGFPVVIGHYWDEFLTFIETLTSWMPEDYYQVVYVHNLSFEFQFLKGLMDFQSADVFAVSPRKVLKATQGHIEFRCSYLHSNMGLAKFLERMGVENQKLNGEVFDYSVTRYPWTNLTDYELQYCINDVVGLVQALRLEMTRDHDTLYSIPLTSTGYVRRDLKYAMRKVSHELLQDCRIDEPVYRMLRAAFRGGNTHANRLYAGQIIENVFSYDIASSYPAVLCNCEFPIGKFTHEGCMSIERYYELKDRGKAMLLHVAFHNPRLRNSLAGCPYLAYAKCTHVIRPFLDNGRIMQADYLETTVTDIDLDIIFDMYDFDDVVIDDSYYARYGLLPKPFVSVILDYFVKKTELKHDKSEDGQYLYMKSKNLLNGIYGCCATDPVRRPIIFNGVDFEYDNDIVLVDVLAKAMKKSFLPYQWGVWCTAWARKRLQTGIDFAGSRFVYCDTDSVKMLDFGSDLRAEFDAFNEERKLEALESGAYATDSLGTTYYMGVYEHDGNYDRFATLGAKKYIYQNGDGKTHCTIAGVNKQKGGAELDRFGGMSAFKEGFIFRDAGGNMPIYNDTSDYLADVEGRQLHITPNVTISESTYCLGIAEEYRRVLQYPNLKELVDKFNVYHIK